MCGRYQVNTPVEDIARRFGAKLTDAAAQLAPRYNVAPSLAVPVVRVRRDVRELAALTWGLVPNWSKDRSGSKPINARAETIFEKAMFRTAILRRRCLIPADGFYEWQQRTAGKQPWHVGMLDGSLFAFAGIWDYWAKEGAEPVVSCAIVVTDANELMARIHDRMPVIVAADDYSRWLDPELHNPVEIRTMLTPYPADEMKAYPISTLVNNAKNEGPELIRPMAEETERLDGNA
jgi:putative SOS response-associated peptidase YedK